MRLVSSTPSISSYTHGRKLVAVHMFYMLMDTSLMFRRHFSSTAVSAKLKSFVILHTQSIYTRDLMSLYSVLSSLNMGSAVTTYFVRQVNTSQRRIS